MEYEEILYDVDDGIATVKFNRPHAMNSGTVQTYRELEDAFRFNDAVLRHMVVARHKADTDPSPLAKNADDRGNDRGERKPAANAS